jgi:hypothetical protein
MVCLGFEEFAKPAVETISSGPIQWDAESGVRFRILIVISESQQEFLIQKILVGEEGCCLEVKQNIPVNLDIQSPVKSLLWNSPFSVTIYFIEHVPMLIEINPNTPTNLKITSSLPL